MKIWVGIGTGRYILESFEKRSLLFVYIIFYSRAGVFNLPAACMCSVFSLIVRAFMSFCSTDSVRVKLYKVSFYVMLLGEKRLSRKYPQIRRIFQKIVLQRMVQYRWFNQSSFLTKWK